MVLFDGMHRPGEDGEECYIEHFICIHTSRLQELTFNTQIKRLGECTQQIVSSRSETGVGTAEVEESHVEQRARDILRTDLGVHGH
jgi:hypothetical protein